MTDLLALLITAVLLVAAVRIVRRLMARWGLLLAGGLLLWVLVETTP